MNIAARIREAQVDFDAQTGRPAKNIYLGDAEWKAISDWAEEIATVKLDEVVQPEYCGMALFHVKADSHLKLSY